MASSSSGDEASKSGVLESASSSTQHETSGIASSDMAEMSQQIQHQRKRSLLGRIWSTFSILGFLFHGSSNEDFEKKLQHLSKEEAAAHTRLKQRSQTWRKLARGLIIYSIIIELLLLGIAVIMTRAPELSWQMRALRVLPVFVFPTLISLIYSTCSSYYRMCERKDQKLIEKLRNERKSKIDELKERTNYYLTQQLIHKYDSDPAAKEAAARVLASKLGADAGLALALEQSGVGESKHALNEPQRHHSSDAFDATGLRRRRAGLERTSSTGQRLPHLGQASNEAGTRFRDFDPGEQAMELDQATGKMTGGGGGGWLARLAAMLVGEDPSQCYALICKSCHMHNGLARKEDFQYIAYYCPHCQALNGSQQLGDSGTDWSNSLATTPGGAGGAAASVNRADLLVAATGIAAVLEPEMSARNYVTASDGSNTSAGNHMSASESSHDISSTAS